MRCLAYWTLGLAALLFVACDDDSSSVNPDEISSDVVTDELSSSATTDALSSSVIPDSCAEPCRSTVGDLPSSSSDKVSSSSEPAQPSSGNELGSSSSETAASSSSQAPKSSAEIAYGTLTDERDGQTYKTVTIGKQTWMAENLNYKTRYSFCYNNKAENCDKYGRLYTWDFAMQACPEGWGLPSLEEFQVLVATIGGLSTAGKVLKSTEGWKDGGNGTDDYGFSALPAGYMNEDSTFYSEGEIGQFWSASGTTWMYQLDLSYDSDEASLFGLYSESGFSVRCLKSAGAAYEVKGTPCKTDSTDTCEYGSVTDDRDGQTYKTVKIGDQWWMAQNLNYETENSFCADDSVCAKYGRFYTWSAAMDSAAKWSESGKGCGLGSSCTPSYPVRGVCPSGWHLPSRDEWTYLRAAVQDAGPIARMLKSTEGWIGGYVNMGGGQAVYDSLADNGKGTDAFGFSGLPAGYWDVRGLRDDGLMTYFWSSSEYAYNSSVHSFLLHICMENAMITSRSKTYGQSVRCVMDR